MEIPDSDRIAAAIHKKGLSFLLHEERMTQDSYGQFITDLKERISKGLASDQWVCDELRKRFERYNWTGIYLLKEEKLVLAAYSGERTEHEVIPLGEGLCSLAIVKDQVVLEPDVKSNTEYLACFPSTNSEIVVPIRLNGRAIGEIDIDSDARDAFSEKDKSFLTEVAKLMAPLVTG